MDYLAHYEISSRMNSQGLHAHDDYEFYIHIRGGRFYCIEDSTFELVPNELLIIPPLHMHGLVCDRDLVDYERCYLSLSGEELKKFEFGELDLIRTLNEFSENRHSPIKLTPSQASSCKDILIALSSNISPIPRLEIFKLILSFLDIVFHEIETFRTTKTLTPPSSPILDVLHYINGHFQEDISLFELSKLFGMSESSISHEFKRYVNRSIYDYILAKRILKAKELLFSKQSLSEISSLCGFNDYSNFLRVFEKRTGMSPKAYREKMLIS